TGDAGAGAPIGVGDLHPAVVVDGGADEVQQVAVAAAGGAGGADGAALHRIGRGVVHGDPARAAVIGERGVEVPDAVEVRGVLVVAGRGGADEADRRPVVVAGDRGREHGVLDAERCADV